VTGLLKFNKGISIISCLTPSFVPIIATKNLLLTLLESDLGFTCALACLSYSAFSFSNLPNGSVTKSVSNELVLTANLTKAYSIPRSFAINFSIILLSLIPKRILLNLPKFYSRFCTDTLPSLAAASCYKAIHYLPVIDGSNIPLIPSILNSP